MTAQRSEHPASGGVWVPSDSRNTADHVIATERTVSVDATFVSTVAVPVASNGALSADAPVPLPASATPRFEPQDIAELSVLVPLVSDFHETDAVGLITPFLPCFAPVAVIGAGFCGGIWWSRRRRDRTGDET